MEKVLFIDVDTQNDFMNQDGALYVADAESIKPNLKRLITHAKSCGHYIVSTIDYHTHDDPEFQWFSSHCVINTRGQQKIAETNIKEAQIIGLDKIENFKMLSRCFVAHKNTFNIFDNINFERLLYLINPDKCFVFGVATDYCVKEVVLGLLERNLSVTIVSDAIKGINKKETIKLIDKFVGLGVELVTTDELLKGLVCV